MQRLKNSCSMNLPTLYGAIMKTIFGIAEDDEHAREIIADLKQVGLLMDQVSIVLMENSQQSDEGGQPMYTNRATTGTAVGGVAGISAGAALGWAATLGAAPVLGPLVAAGPLLAILSGAAIGGTTGSVLGAIVGAGMPQHHTKHYEDMLHAGSVIIAAHPHSNKEEVLAHRIFRKHGVAEVPERELNLASNPKLSGL
jgi:hypothetical protein